MSAVHGQRVNRNRPRLLRDFVRDYCLLCDTLEEQRRRFAASGTLSYAVLHELIGDNVQSGLFRRLKNGAHHLFRTQSGSGAALLLDWAVSYAFHECVKLKEDAFQHRHYRSLLLDLRARFGLDESIRALEPLLSHNRESAERELARILHTLAEGRALLARCLPGQGAERYLARFFLEHGELARRVLDPVYPRLLEKLYGPEAERLIPAAAEAFLEGGRPRRALEVLDGFTPSPALAAATETLRKSARIALGHTP